MSNIVSQRDPQWGNIKLGTSNVNISGYGCTITCLGYLVGLTPDKVNERMNTVGGYSNGNLVIWTKVLLFLNFLLLFLLLLTSLWTIKTPYLFGYYQ